MDAKSKDLVNSSSGGSFEKLRLSKAKIVLGRLLNARREYEKTSITPSQENVKSTSVEVRNNLLMSRVDKLEEILQSVCKLSQHPTVPIQTHFQVDQVNHQRTGEEWSSSLKWNPEGQAEVCQLEHPPCGEWSQSEEYSTLPYHAEPYPIPTQTPPWPMEYLDYQPYPEFQDHEFDPPTYQPDHSCHFISIPSHPYQTYHSEEGDFFPTWSDEEWQTQNAHLHQDQTCPDQFQNQPCLDQLHPRKSFEPTFEEDNYANSIAGETEGATAFQQNMQSCARSEAETVMDMQPTYEEQQSDMDVMIRQVALLTEMIKEIRQNRARSEADGNNEEDGKQKETNEADGESLSNEEKESEALLEGARTVEIDSDEEETLREEEVILHGVKLNNTLFYLQEEEVHVPSEMVDEYTTKVKKEKRPEERPPPKTYKSEGNHYEGERPEPKEEGSRRKAARSIYRVRLQPWPEPLEEKKPPCSGLRPKENKKVQGTYRHHRKKRDVTLKKIAKEN